MSENIILRGTPAADWEDATPIGCGNLGAMIFGGTDCEKIYLSEESVWSGEERDTTVPGYREKIDFIRNKYLSGESFDMDALADELLTPGIERVKSLEYAGLITVTRGDMKAENYSRRLLLDKAVAEIGFESGGVKYSETAFASYPAGLIAFEFTSSSESGINFVFSRENTVSKTFENGTMLVAAKTAYGEHRFCAAVRFVSDGTVSGDGCFVRIDNATRTVMYVTVMTELMCGEGFCELARGTVNGDLGFESLKAAHIADYSSLFSRSEISFDCPDELKGLSVEKRLKRLKNDAAADDYGLYSLYFAFAKYLLISSSREGTLPANLQGVWVEKLENPWNADYHTNINLQMNYWLPEVANIAEVHLPLFDYMNNYLLESGRKTARVNYGVEGTVVHHLSDIYGFTTPADGLWGIWPMGGAWLCYHMWEHYLYSCDRAFLKDTAYEYIRDSALFFINYMFEDKNGRLLNGPSMSPENRFYQNIDGRKMEAYLTFSPTMDTEIISGLLSFYIEIEKLLGIAPENIERAQKALDKLPPLKVGKHGQLMEWLEDYDEPEPGHRHISHAFGLHPGKTITRDTPELFSAIEKTLERRLSNGGGHTGWSRAWLINLYARLHNGEETDRNIRLLLTKSTNDNLLDIHPPFQIDGNFGGGAGIAEMLLQSHEGFISILPAASAKMSGSFTRLMARGNIEVSCSFKNGQPLSFTLKTPFSQTVFVELPGKAEKLKIDLKANEVFSAKVNN